MWKIKKSTSALSLLLATEEQRLGLPVAAFREHVGTPLEIGKLQSNFIEYIVQPLWTTVIELFPMEKPIEYLEMNHQRYKVFYDACGKRKGVIMFL